jgi:hypothetical protein
MCPGFHCHQASSKLQNNSKRRQHEEYFWCKLLQAMMIVNPANFEPAQQEISSYLNTKKQKLEI